jgi:uncharacterized membrane protein
MRLLLAAEYLVALSCGGVLAASVTGGRLLWPVLAVVFAGVLALLVWVAVSVRHLPHEPVRNPAAWRGGLLYFDRTDPALFVPKRVGIGYTFNFGHPAAIALVFALFIVPLAIALFAALNAR